MLKWIYWTSAVFVGVALGMGNVKLFIVSLAVFVFLGLLYAVEEWEKL